MVDIMYLLVTTEFVQYSIGIDLSVFSNPIELQQHKSNHNCQ